MDNKLKGDLAELIVEHMFRASGIKVFPLGVERRNQNFFEYYMKRKEDTNRKLKFNNGVARAISIPDFVIEDLDGNFELIEVKFRGQIKSEDDLVNFHKDVEESVNFWKCTIILVTNPYPPDNYFTVLRYEEEFCSRQTIPGQKLWGIKREVFTECENLVKCIYT